MAAVIQCAPGNEHLTVDNTVAVGYQRCSCIGEPVLSKHTLLHCILKNSPRAFCAATGGALKPR